MDPIETVILQWQRRKERRPDRQRVHRRSEVVQKPWKRQLHRAGSAAGLSFRLKYVDLQPCLSKSNRRRETVRSRADHTCAADHVRAPHRSRSQVSDLTIIRKREFFLTPKT